MFRQGFESIWTKAVNSSTVWLNLRIDGKGNRGVWRQVVNYVECQVKNLDFILQAMGRY